MVAENIVEPFFQHATCMGINPISPDQMDDSVDEQRFSQSHEPPSPQPPGELYDPATQPQRDTILRIVQEEPVVSDQSHEQKPKVRMTRSFVSTDYDEFGNF